MSVIRFATNARDVRERHRQWAAVTASSGLVLHDDGIEASIRGGDVGPARICTVALGGHSIVNDSTAAARPRIKLVFQEEGRCRFEQADRAVLLERGQWCAYDKARPYAITQDGRSRQSALVLPTGTAGRRQASWTDQLVRRYSAQSGADRILHSCLVEAVNQLDSLCEAGRGLMGQTLLNLVDLTLLARRETSSLHGNRRMRLMQIVAHVDGHLANPDLDIDAIAHAFGCSKRYLHKLFRDHDTTLSRLIWNRRLDRCYADLCNPDLAHRTITDIAFAWGFKDSHHFSRLFRCRFGLTARAFRQDRRLQ